MAFVFCVVVAGYTLCRLCTAWCSYVVRPEHLRILPSSCAVELALLYVLPCCKPDIHQVLTCRGRCEAGEPINLRTLHTPWAQWPSHRNAQHGVRRYDKCGLAQEELVTNVDLTYSCSKQCPLSSHIQRQNPWRELREVGGMAGREE